MLEVSLDEAILAERQRWLKAVVVETQRQSAAERWACLLTDDYEPSFHPTKERATVQALRYVDQKNLVGG